MSIDGQRRGPALGSNAIRSIIHGPRGGGLPPTPSPWIRYGTSQSCTADLVVRRAGSRIQCMMCSMECNIHNPGLCHC